MSGSGIGNEAEALVPQGYLDEEGSFVLLRVDSSRVIQSCNSFGRALLGFDPVGRAWRDVVVDFTGLLDPALLPPPGEGEPQLVNVRTFTGLPESLRCRALPTGAGHLVLGSLDAREVETLRFEVLELNREMGGLTRSLQKANTELARLNDLKSQFLGMAAHDLRRPAGAILAYAELLLDGAGGGVPEDRSYLERIVTATRFMAAVIDNFLATALSDAGALTLSREEVRARGLVDEVLLLCGPVARRKGVSFTTSVPDDLPGVDADRSKLEQALLNLVVNAVEHSPRGSRVDLAARVRDGRLVLDVRDQGPGIAPEEIGNLFETYARGSARKTAGERSTGLGLAIARLVAVAHGGRITVESEPGRGSTFALEVPLEKGALSHGT